MSCAHALVGREFLDEAIARGFGSLRVDDSVWRVAGEGMPTGTWVRVVAIEDGSAISGGKGMSRKFSRPTQGSMKCENS